MNRIISHSRIITFGYLLGITSGCSTSRSKPPVEPISLVVQEQFESITPEFEGFISRGVDCALDENGRVYVLDSIERHIVVFDSSLTAINVIGRDGDGPGELRIFPRSGYHYLAVGGGFIVAGTDPNLIHVFDTEGTFLNRFTPDPRPCDIVVREDGVIVTHTYDVEFPIVEYDIQGNLLRKYGRAVIRPGEDLVQQQIHQMRNRGSVALLPDDGLITFNSDYLWLGHYQAGDLLNETMLDLSDMIRLAGSDKESRKIGRNIMKELHSHDPVRINRAAGVRTLTNEDFPQMMTSGYITTDGKLLWGAFGDWLWQITSDGHINRIFDTAQKGSHNFVIRGSRIIFLRGTEISIGTIPAPIIR